MLNLNLPTDRDALAERIKNDINEFCSTFYEQGHRNHLGASELGDECWRKLWYTFRWVKRENFSGRILRLFNVGNIAETRFINYLRGIGFEVREFTEDGKQFRISGANDHYGGSLDGMCKAPRHYEISEDLIFLNEFKTNATGSGYTDVEKNGVAKAKPKHFAQMSQYGYKLNLKYGIYLIENKNDSDITIKIVELDWNLGAQLEKKAESIIFSKEPPPRISDNPAMFNCKFCTYSGICHNGELPERNCRSCRNCSPVPDAKWFCSHYNDNPPNDFIKLGCDNWLPI
jgi:hypothetical protein